MTDQPISRKEDVVAPAMAPQSPKQEPQSNSGFAMSLIDLNNKMKHDIWVSKHQDQIKSAKAEKDKARKNINNTLAKIPKNKYTKADIASAANSDRGKSLTELATMPIVEQGSSAPTELKQGKSVEELNKDIAMYNMLEEKKKPSLLQNIKIVGANLMSTVGGMLSPGTQIQNTIAAKSIKDEVQQELNQKVTAINEMQKPYAKPVTLKSILDEKNAKAKQDCFTIKDGKVVIDQDKLNEYRNRIRQNLDDTVYLGMLEGTNDYMDDLDIHSLKNKINDWFSNNEYHQMVSNARMTDMNLKTLQKIADKGIALDFNETDFGDFLNPSNLGNLDPTGSRSFSRGDLDLYGWYNQLGRSIGKKGISGIGETVTSWLNDPSKIFENTPTNDQAKQAVIGILGLSGDTKDQELADQLNKLRQSKNGTINLLNDIADTALMMTQFSTWGMAKKATAGVASKFNKGISKFQEAAGAKSVQWLEEMGINNVKLPKSVHDMSDILKTQDIMKAKSFGDRAKWMQQMFGLSRESAVEAALTSFATQFVSNDPNAISNAPKAALDMAKLDFMNNMFGRSVIAVMGPMQGFIKRAMPNMTNGIKKAAMQKMVNAGYQIMSIPAGMANFVTSNESMDVDSYDFWKEAIVNGIFAYNGIRGTRKSLGFRGGIRDFAESARYQMVYGKDEVSFADYVRNELGNKPRTLSSLLDVPTFLHKADLNKNEKEMLKTINKQAGDMSIEFKDLTGTKFEDRPIYVDNETNQFVINERNLASNSINNKKNILNAILHEQTHKVNDHLYMTNPEFKNESDKAASFVQNVLFQDKNVRDLIDSDPALHEAASYLYNDDTGLNYDELFSVLYENDNPLKTLFQSYDYYETDKNGNIIYDNNYLGSRIKKDKSGKVMMGKDGKPELENIWEIDAKGNKVFTPRSKGNVYDHLMDIMTNGMNAKGGAKNYFIDGISNIYKNDSKHAMDLIKDIDQDEGTDEKRKRIENYTYNKLGFRNIEHFYQNYEGKPTKEVQTDILEKAKAKGYTEAEALDMSHRLALNVANTRQCKIIDIVKSNVAKDMEYYKIEERSSNLDNFGKKIDTRDGKLDFMTKAVENLSKTYNESDFVTNANKRYDAFGTISPAHKEAASALKESIRRIPEYLQNIDKPDIAYFTRSINNKWKSTTSGDPREVTKALRESSVRNGYWIPPGKTMKICRLPDFVKEGFDKAENAKSPQEKVMAMRTLLADAKNMSEYGFWRAASVKDPSLGQLAGKIDFTKFITNDYKKAEELGTEIDPTLLDKLSSFRDDYYQGENHPKQVFKKFSSEDLANMKLVSDYVKYQEPTDNLASMLTNAIDDYISWITDPATINRNADGDAKHNMKYYPVTADHEGISLDNDSYNYFKNDITKNEDGSVSTKEYTDDEMGVINDNEGNKAVYSAMIPDEIASKTIYKDLWANSKADGGERIINKELMRMLTKVADGPKNNTFIKLKRADVDVINKSGHHYDDMERTMPDGTKRKLIADHTVDGKRISIISPQSAFKGKKASKPYELYFKRKGYPEGRILMSNEGNIVGADSPEIKEGFSNYCIEQLNKGIIPDELTHIVPITGPKGFKVLTSAHTPHRNKGAASPLASNPALECFRFSQDPNRRKLWNINNQQIKNRENQAKFEMKCLASLYNMTQSVITSGKTEYERRDLYNAGVAMNMLKDQLLKNYDDEAPSDMKNLYSKAEYFDLVENLVDDFGYLNPVNFTKFLLANERFADFKHEGGIGQLKGMLKESLEMYTKSSMSAIQGLCALEGDVRGAIRRGRSRELSHIRKNVIASERLNDITKEYQNIYSDQRYQDINKEVSKYKKDRYNLQLEIEETTNPVYKRELIDKLKIMDDKYQIFQASRLDDMPYYEQNKFRLNAIDQEINDMFPDYRQQMKETKAYTDLLENMIDPVTGGFVPGARMPDGSLPLVVSADMLQTLSKPAKRFKGPSHPSVNYKSHNEFLEKYPSGAGIGDLVATEWNREANKEISLAFSNKEYYYTNVEEIQNQLKLASEKNCTINIPNYETYGPVIRFCKDNDIDYKVHFDPEGDIPAIPEESAYYSEESPSEFLGIGSKLLMGLTPAAGPDSMMPITVIGIADGTNVLYTDNSALTKIWGRDFDADKVGLIRWDQSFTKDLHDEMWQALLDYGVTQGRATRLADQYRSEMKEIGMFEFAKKHGIPTREWDSRPQSTLYQDTLPLISASQGDGINMRNKMAQYIRENPDIVGDKITDEMIDHLEAMTNIFAQNSVDTYDSTKWHAQEAMFKLFAKDLPDMTGSTHQSELREFANDNYKILNNDKVFREQQLDAFNTKGVSLAKDPLERAASETYRKLLKLTVANKTIDTEGKPKLDFDEQNRAWVDKLKTPQLEEMANNVTQNKELKESAYNLYTIINKKAVHWAEKEKQQFTDLFSRNAILSTGHKDANNVIQRLNTALNNLSRAKKGDKDGTSKSVKGFLLSSFMYYTGPDGKRKLYQDEFTKKAIGLTYNWMLKGAVLSNREQDIYNYNGKKARYNGKSIDVYDLVTGEKKEFQVNEIFDENGDINKEVSFLQNSPGLENIFVMPEVPTPHKMTELQIDLAKNFAEIMSNKANGQGLNIDKNIYTHSLIYTPDGQAKNINPCTVYSKTVEAGIPYDLNMDGQHKSGKEWLQGALNYVGEQHAPAITRNRPGVPAIESKVNRDNTKHGMSLASFTESASKEGSIFHDKKAVGLFTKALKDHATLKGKTIKDIANNEADYKTFYDDIITPYVNSAINLKDDEDRQKKIEDVLAMYHPDYMNIISQPYDGAMKERIGALAIAEMGNIIHGINHAGDFTKRTEISVMRSHVPEQILQRSSTAKQLYDPNHIIMPNFEFRNGKLIEVEPDTMGSRINPLTMTNNAIQYESKILVDTILPLRNIVEHSDRVSEMLQDVTDFNMDIDLPEINIDTNLDKEGNIEEGFINITKDGNTVGYVMNDDNLSAIEAQYGKPAVDYIKSLKQFKAASGSCQVMAAKLRWLADRTDSNTPAAKTYLGNAIRLEKFGQMLYEMNPQTFKMWAVESKLRPEKIVDMLESIEGKTKGAYFDYKKGIEEAENLLKVFSPDKIKIRAGQQTGFWLGKFMYSFLKKAHAADEIDVKYKDDFDAFIAEKGYDPNSEITPELRSEFWKDYGTKKLKENLHQESVRMSNMAKKVEEEKGFSYDELESKLTSKLASLENYDRIEFESPEAKELYIAQNQPRIDNIKEILGRLSNARDKQTKPLSEQRRAKIDQRYEDLFMEIQSRSDEDGNIEMDGSEHAELMELDRLRQYDDLKQAYQSAEGDAKKELYRQILDVRKEMMKAEVESKQGLIDNKDLIDQVAEQYMTSLDTNLADLQESNNYAYNLFQKMNIPGFEKDFTSLNGEEKKNLSGIASRYISELSNRYKDKFNNGLKVSDWNNAKSQEDIIMSDKFGAITIDSALKGLSIDGILYADMEINDKINKDDFSYNPNNVLKKANGLIMSARQDIENNMIDDLHAAGEKNKEAIRIGADMIMKANNRDVLYDKNLDFSHSKQEIMDRLDSKDVDTDYITPGALVNLLADDKHINGRFIGFYKRRIIDKEGIQKQDSQSFTDENGNPVSVEKPKYMKCALVYNPSGNNIYSVNLDLVQSIYEGRYASKYQQDLQKRQGSHYKAMAEDMLQGLSNVCPVIESNKTIYTQKRQLTDVLTTDGTKQSIELMPERIGFDQLTFSPEEKNSIGNSQFFTKNGAITTLEDMLSNVNIAQSKEKDKLIAKSLKASNLFRIGGDYLLGGAALSILTGTAKAAFTGDLLLAAKPLFKAGVKVTRAYFGNVFGVSGATAPRELGRWTSMKSLFAPFKTAYISAKKETKNQRSMPVANQFTDMVSDAFKSVRSDKLQLKKTAKAMYRNFTDIKDAKYALDLVLKLSNNLTYEIEGDKQGKYNTLEGAIRSETSKYRMDDDLLASQKELIKQQLIKEYGKDAKKIDWKNIELVDLGGKLVPLYKGIGYDEVKDLKLSLADGMFNLLSLGGLYQSFENLSSSNSRKVVTAYADDMLKRMDEVNNRLGNSGLSRDDVFRTNMINRMTKVAIGNYDRNPFHKTLVGKGITQFSHFNKERKVDAIMGLTARKDLYDAFSEACGKDTEYQELLHESGLHGLLTGKGLLYDPSKELRNRFIASIPTVAKNGAAKALTIYSMFQIYNSVINNPEFAAFLDPIWDIFSVADSYGQTTSLITKDMLDLFLLHDGIKINKRRIDAGTLANKINSGIQAPGAIFSNLTAQGQGSQAFVDAFGTLEIAAYGLLKKQYPKWKSNKGLEQAQMKNFLEEIGQLSSFVLPGANKLSQEVEFIRTQSNKKAKKIKDPFAGLNL